MQCLNGGLKLSTKKKTTEDHQERINKVLTYIKKHKSESHSVKQLAIVACYSPFHFHRIFSAFTGESLLSYIRRIRLEAAASMLSYGKESIIQIALEVGYESHGAFTKAFRGYFGVSPSEYRVSPVHIEKSNHQLTTDIIKDIIMQSKIVTMDEQLVLFVQKTGPYSQAAEEAWSALCQYAYPNKLMKKDTLSYGISYDDPNVTAPENLRYEACISLEAPIKVKGSLETKTIAGGRYAVFLHKGPYENFSKTYDWIYSQWLPTSKEELRDTPCFENYMNRDPRRTKPENLKTEIYVPLK
jgi:AraC family transcriptional regulator